MPIRRILTCATAAAALLIPAATAQAHASTPNPLVELTDVAAQRVLISDQVAAAKFPDQPIDAPAREQEELDAARKSAIELGLDPDATVAFFRDQIAASKVVQHGLFAYWRANPAAAPTSKPDLGQIRVKLDRMTTELLTDLQQTKQLRQSPACGPLRTTAELHVAADRHLDPLHFIALLRAMPSACE
jgi:chorismate mutase